MEGRTPISCTWLFKIKRNVDGEVEDIEHVSLRKYFLRRLCLWQSLTVAKHAVVRIVLSLKVLFNCFIRQVDVNIAFLMGYLPEEVYMSRTPEI